MKRRRKRKTEKTNKENKQGRENYKETTGKKLINNTKKKKLKSRLEFGISKIQC